MDEYYENQEPSSSFITNLQLMITSKQLLESVETESDTDDDNNNI